MDKIKLTKRAADSWVPEKAGAYLWDGELKGFGLKANKGGSKSFVIQYRNRYGRTRRYTIGKYGGALTPNEARNTAKTLLARIVADGFDPMEKRESDRASLTVNQLLDRYLESAKFAQKTDNTQAIDTGRLNRHIRPLLGKKMVEALTRERILNVFTAIRDGKTAVNVKVRPGARARVTGGEGTARMSIRLLRAIFNWAIVEGLADSNPTIGVDTGKDAVRNVIIESSDQYRKLFDSLQVMEDEHRIQSNAANVIRLLALTGARKGEITGLEWSHVDLERGFLILPPKAHKAGFKTGEEKRIALTAPAQVIIANQAKVGESDFVFPPTSGVGPITLSSRLWAKIRAEAGLPEGFTAHSLRHSLGTLMAVQGAQAADIMAQLGHSQVDTTMRYIHYADDARVAIAERHTAGIAAALEGREKADVVDLIPTRKN